MAGRYEGGREANCPYPRSVCSTMAVARLVRNKKCVLSMILPENSNLQTQLIFRKCPTHTHDGIFFSRESFPDYNNHTLNPNMNNTQNIKETIPWQNPLKGTANKRHYWQSKVEQNVMLYHY